MPRSEVQETLSSVASLFGDATFTTSQAEAAGIAVHRIVSAVRAGGVLRLWRGHYVLANRSIDSTIPGLSELHSAQARAVIERLPELPTAIGDVSAAQAWDMPLQKVPVPASPVLLVPSDSRVRSGVHRGVRFVYRDVDPQRIVTGPGGVPMTDPLLTAIHVSSRAGLELGTRLVVLNGGMRRHLEWQVAARAIAEGGPAAAQARSSSLAVARWVNDPALRRNLIEEAVSASRTADIRGRLRVIETLDLADPRLETALESLSWSAFVEAGISLPTPQVDVVGASGRHWRVDFIFGERVIGECDGAVKYSDPQALWREKKRQEDLEQADYIVVRWTWEEIVHRPWDVVRRILDAIARAGRLAPSA